jgi:hypothetical protein
VNRGCERGVFRLEIRDELVERTGIQERAREHVAACFARFLEHGDRQWLAPLRLLQLGELERGG